MLDYSFIGSGKVYVRVYGAAAGLKEIGNCSRLSLGVTEDTKTLIDHTQAGGGTYNEVRRIQAVEATIVMHDLSPENLGRALFGDPNTVNSGTVTAEVVTAYLDSIIPLAKIPSGSIVVKHSTGTPVYTAGTDYVVRGAGIYIPASGSAITDAQSIKVDYAYAAQNRVEALINAAQDYEMLFEGLNEARSGKVVTVRVRRMKIGAARELGLITDDHAQLEISGKLQKDTTITGAGLSQYFTMALVT